MKEQSKKNVAIGLATATLAALMLPALTACNYDVLDMKYEFNYAVIEENGKSVLHEVKSWSDSESDSVTLSTKCCDNYIWTSANKAVMYKNKPSEDRYDTVCDHTH